MVLKSIKKIISKLLKNKILFIFFILIIISGFYIGYTKIFKANNSPRYVLAKVKKGDFVVTISGTGQVSGLNQLDIKSKVGGEVLRVYKNLGQEVKANELLALIDTKDAELGVKDAERALEAAKLELDKLLKPVDNLTLTQAENSLASAKEDKQKAQDNLKKAYEDGFNTVSNVFIDLADVMNGLKNLLFSNSFSSNQWNIDYYADSASRYDEGVALLLRNAVYDKYLIAKEAYDKNFNDYKNISRFSEEKTIEQLILQTYETTKLVAEAIKDTSSFIQYYQEKLIERNLKPIADSSNHLSNLSSYTKIINNHLLNLLAIKRLIQDYNEAILNYDRIIKERVLYLEKIKEGPDELDIRAKKLIIQQKEDALIKAKQLLEDHYIRAPFSGILAKINIKKGDNISSGFNVFTIVTKRKIAEIVLNEVDVAKVKIGQKAVLTFDAIPDLKVTGEVMEIDAVGSVSQGVVSYTVKIGFDTQDERIKTSMSVSAEIIIDAKSDVLLVPNSAIKSQRDKNYVEIVEGIDLNKFSFMNPNGVVLKNNFRQQYVEVGKTNDEVSEILNGLKEGDVIIVRTIEISDKNVKNQQNSSLRIPGFSSGGGFRVR